MDDVLVFLAGVALCVYVMWHAYGQPFTTACYRARGWPGGLVYTVGMVLAFAGVTGLA